MPHPTAPLTAQLCGDHAARAMKNIGIAFTKHRALRQGPNCVRRCQLGSPAPPVALVI